MYMKMDSSYIAGFFDGDGTVCIGKCRGGFQLKVELTQCNEEFTKYLANMYDAKIYFDTRLSKYNNETACSLRLCGLQAIPVLILVSKYGVVKQPQAVIALEYLSMARQRGLYNKREEYYMKLKEMNTDKTSYDKDYSTISNGYIAGLFDAEGNVYNAIINGKHRYYVKITQKCDPVLISNIQKYLGFGKIAPSEPYRLVFHSRNDIINFWKVINPYVYIKKDQYLALLNAFGVMNINIH